MNINSDEIDMQGPLVAGSTIYGNDLVRSNGFKIFWVFCFLYFMHFNGDVFVL